MKADCEPDNDLRELTNTSTRLATHMVARCRTLDLVGATWGGVPLELFRRGKDESRGRPNGCNVTAHSF